MAKIEHSWYHKHWSHVLLWTLLWPLSLLFRLIAWFRRICFKLGFATIITAEKPVIVVGNISVGGNGKTPFVIYLVEMLKAHGIKAGVISRGYGGKSDRYPIAVDDSLDTAIFGDEPVLIYRRCDVPVVVGSNRVENCQMLCQLYDVDVIVCDDGLQHYRLARDMEIVIVDGAREFGNQQLMPLGPLREGLWRLKTVDYVIYNGHNPDALTNHDGHFSLDVSNLVALIPSHPNSIKMDESTNIHGICAIGNSARFEQTLTLFLNQQGKKLASFTPFADHHKFTPQDLTKFGDDVVIMTEKDAVKCVSFARHTWCYLPVDATLTPTLGDKLLKDIQQLIKD